MSKSILLFVSIVLLLNGCGKQTAATQKLDETSVKIGIMGLNWPKTEIFLPGQWPTFSGHT
ncbi:MAG: hypothetical protein LT080_11825 [Thiobacillus sp.]|nr:hypothetical protein [Thiobacillus sp.]